MRYSENNCFRNSVIRNSGGGGNRHVHTKGGGKPNPDGGLQGEREREVESLSYIIMIFFIKQKYYLNSLVQLLNVIVLQQFNWTWCTLHLIHTSLVFTAYLSCIQRQNIALLVDKLLGYKAKLQFTQFNLFCSSGQGRGCGKTKILLRQGSMDSDRGGKKVQNML